MELKEYLRILKEAKKIKDWNRVGYCIDVMEQDVKLPMPNHLVTTGESITDASYDAIKDKEYIDLDVLMQTLPLIDKKMKACLNCNGILTVTYDDKKTKIVDAHCDRCGFKGGVV